MSECYPGQYNDMKITSFIRYDVKISMSMKRKTYVVYTYPGGHSTQSDGDFAPSFGL